MFDRARRPVVLARQPNTTPSPASYHIPRSPLKNEPHPPFYTRMTWAREHDQQQPSGPDIFQLSDNLEDEDDVPEPPFEDEGKPTKTVFYSGTIPYNPRLIMRDWLQKFKKAPFCSNSSRFAKDPQDEFPGPADYENAVGLSENLLRKQHLHFTHAVAFEKSYPPTLSRMPCPLSGPGPASHDVKKEQECKNEFGRTTLPAFASKTKRLIPTLPPTPSPAAYCWELSKDAIQNKSNFFSPSECRKKQVGFNVSSARHTPPYNPEGYSTLAGPGRYNLEGSLEHGPSIPRAMESSELECLPGPAHYQLNPYHMHTCILRTHNLDLCRAAMHRIRKWARRDVHVGMAGVERAIDGELIMECLRVKKCQPCHRFDLGRYQDIPGMPPQKNPMSASKIKMSSDEAKKIVPASA